MKKKWFPAAVLVFSLMTSLFWTALRVNYSGISKFLGADTNPTFLVMNLPVLICVLAWAGTALPIMWACMCMPSPKPAGRRCSM